MGTVKAACNTLGKESPTQWLFQCEQLMQTLGMSKVGRAGYTFVNGREIKMELAFVFPWEILQRL